MLFILKMETEIQREFILSLSTSEIEKFMETCILPEVIKEKENRLKNTKQSKLINQEFDENDLLELESKNAKEKREDLFLGSNNVLSGSSGEQEKITEKEIKIERGRITIEQSRKDILPMYHLEKPCLLKKPCLYRGTKYYPKHDYKYNIQKANEERKGKELEKQNRKNQDDFINFVFDKKQKYLDFLNINLERATKDVELNSKCGFYGCVNKPLECAKIRQNKFNEALMEANIYLSRIINTREYYYENYDEFMKLLVIEPGAFHPTPFAVQYPPENDPFQLHIYKYFQRAKNNKEDLIYFYLG